MSVISSLPHSEPCTPFAMEDSISTAQWLITKWKCNPISASAPSPNGFLFMSARKEATEYIDCVNELRRTMDFYASTSSASPKLALAYELMQSAMQRLETEFRHLLVSNNKGLTAFIDGEYRMVCNSVVEDLKMIASCMIKSGHGIQVARVHQSERKLAVNHELAELGFQKLKSLKDVNDGLDKMAKIWMRATFLAVGTVFTRERILCDHIFAASDVLREYSFTETTKDGATMVLATGEVVANTGRKRSTESIFALMEMHSALKTAISEIESIFCFDSTSSVRSQAVNFLSKLSTLVSSALEDFESAIRKHSSKTGVPGGGIHPLTESTMNYICRLADYGDILSAIITDHPSSSDKSWMPESFFDTKVGNGSPMSVRLARLILVLLCKLDKLAESYKDVSLSYLFLANNLHLVVEKVRTSSNVLELIGEAWVIRHGKTEKQYASKYEFTAWNKVVMSLTSAQDLSTKEAKERLRKFKLALEQAIKKQRSWIVADGRIREELKAAVKRRVLSAYTEFYEANVVNLLGGDVMKLGPPELNAYISDLFGAGVYISGDSTTSDSSLSKSLSWSSSGSPSRPNDTMPAV